VALAEALAGGAMPRVFADSGRPAPGAPAPAGAAVSVASPANGAVVTTKDIPVRVAAQNFTIACDEAGMATRDGVGHLHVMIDGTTMAQLTNFYCTQNFWISGQGVPPGQHVLTIDLATNDHADMEETAQTVTFVYQPSPAPAALPAPDPQTGATIAINAPAAGATVGPQFDLKVESAKFHASCDLEGKPNLAGYGHYHVFVDEDLSMPMDMTMMGMPGMIAMPCTDTIPLDLSAWPSGKHTIAVELEQNDHTPLMDPGAGGAKFATVSVNLQNPFRP
jgi:hypothetical protein